MHRRSRPPPTRLPPIDLIGYEKDLTWSSLLTRFEAEDRATRQTLGNSGLVMYLSDEKKLPRFLEALPPELVTFILQDSATPSYDITQRNVVITGECPDLRALGFSCQGQQDLSGLPTRTRTLLAQLYVEESDRVQVKAGPLSSVKTDDATLSISDPSGRAMDRSEIKKIAYGTMAFVPEIFDLEEGGFSNSTSTAQQSLWIVLFGIGTTLALGAALGVTAVTRFREQADDLGAVSILTDRRAPFWGIGAWTVAVPMVLGAWTALAVSRIVIDPLTSVPDGPTLSETLQILAPVVLTVIALLTWVYVSVNTVRYLRDWKPRNA
jgi:hypothetical protein